MRRLGLALLLLLALVAACGGPRSGEGGFVGGDGSLIRYSAGERKTMPKLEGVDLDGKPLSWREAAGGKPVIVNVWGSWCGPCRAGVADMG